MKRLIITASGEVQRVGYRDRVTKNAKKIILLGLSGIALDMMLKLSQKEMKMTWTGLYLK
jgi:hypothetical protein